MWGKGQMGARMASGARTAVSVVGLVSDSQLEPKRICGLYSGLGGIRYYSAAVRFSLLSDLVPAKSLTLLTSAGMLLSYGL
jgi:hypothetical protein